MSRIDLKKEINILIGLLDKQEQQFHKTRSVNSRVLGAVQAGSFDDDFCLGDIRLRKIKTQLNMFGVTRSQDQKRFHDAFILACLPKIYGDKEWNKYSERILRENKIQTIHYEGSD